MLIEFAKAGAVFVAVHIFANIVAVFPKAGWTLSGLPPPLSGVSLSLLIFNFSIPFGLNSFYKKLFSESDYRLILEVALGGSVVF